jgi:hypothetical protein
MYNIKYIFSIELVASGSVFVILLSLSEYFIKHTYNNLQINLKDILLQINTCSL